VAAFSGGGHPYFNDLEDQVADRQLDPIPQSCHQRDESYDWFYHNQALKPLIPPGLGRRLRVRLSDSYSVSIHDKYGSRVLGPTLGTHIFDYARLVSCNRLQWLSAAKFFSVPTDSF
jgi:hypothetical protein